MKIAVCHVLRVLRKLRYLKHPPNNYIKFILMIYDNIIIIIVTRQYYSAFVATLCFYSIQRCSSHIFSHTDNVFSSPCTTFTC